MSSGGDDSQVMERVCSQIRSAFPDLICSGPITPADGKTGEDYDEHEILFEGLRGRAWSRIPASFIRENAGALVLLTEEAFVVYLPAWLIAGVTDHTVGEILAYTFCPAPDGDQRFMDSRIKRMNVVQREALAVFLAYCVETNSSKVIKDRAEEALAYVSSL